MKRIFKTCILGFSFMSLCTLAACMSEADTGADRASTERASTTQSLGDPSLDDQSLDSAGLGDESLVTPATLQSCVLQCGDDDLCKLCCRCVAAGGKGSSCCF
jgi:hypothetical protein